MTHRIAEAERDRKAVRPWITRSFVRAKPVIDWQSAPEMTHNSRTLASRLVDLEAATRRSIRLGAAVARRRIAQAATAAQAVQANVQAQAEAAQEPASPCSTPSLGDDEIDQLFRRNSEIPSSEMRPEDPGDVEDEAGSAEVQSATPQSSMDGESRGGFAECRRAASVPRSVAAAEIQKAALPDRNCLSAADKICDLVDEANAAECEGTVVDSAWEQPIEEDAFAIWDATNGEEDIDAGVMRESVAAEVDEAVDDSTLLDQAEPDRPSASGKPRKTRVKSKKAASNPRGVCAGSRA
eukprot:5366331-Pleurochrysis_carterae.AAC.1